MILTGFEKVNFQHSLSKALDIAKIEARPFSFERLTHLRKLDGGRYLFSIKRHPSIFELSTLGRPSTAYFNLRQRWELDTLTCSISLISEKVTSHEVDYEAEAKRRIEMYLDTAITDSELVGIDSEDEVIEEVESVEWCDEDEFNKEFPSSGWSEVAVKINLLAAEFGKKEALKRWKELREDAVVMK